ncbi:MAG: hypothetical protein WA741_32815 [Candidatus Sulfotelmatobacter sp.]
MNLILSMTSVDRKKAVKFPRDRRDRPWSRVKRFGAHLHYFAVLVMQERSGLPSVDPIQTTTINPIDGE